MIPKKGWLVSLIVPLLSAAHLSCVSTSNMPQDPIAVSKGQTLERWPSLVVAPIRFESNVSVLGEWVDSTSFLPKEEIRAVVVASWCGISQGYLADLAAGWHDPAGVDLVLFFDDELDSYFSRLAASGKMDQGAADDLANRAAITGAVLAAPREVPIEEVSSYAVKRAELGLDIDRYPTFFVCDSESCRLTDEDS